MIQTSFSVVIVSYFSSGTLIKNVMSALKLKGLDEVIVVNNGNIRLINEVLRDLSLFKEKLRVINNTSNIGFAAAANLAVENCKSEYILFLSPDCVLSTDDIAANLIAQLRKHEAQIAGVKLIDEDNNEIAPSRKKILNPFNAFMSFWGMKSFYNKGGKNVPSTPTQIDAISSKFMFVEAAYFKKLGGFDEKYFLFCEDADFCRRLRKDKGKIMYFSGHKVLYEESGSNVSNKFLDTFKMQSINRYFQKHYIWAFPFCWFFSIFYHMFFSSRRKDGRNIRFRENCLTTALQYANAAPLTDKLKFYKPKSVMIVGATNQVGIAVMRLLLKMDCNIIATYRTEKPDFEHPNISWRQYDLESESAQLDVSNCDGVICTSYLPSVVGQADRFGIGKVRSAIFTSCLEPKAKLSRFLTKKDKTRIDEISQAEEIILDAYKESETNCCIIKPTMIYGYGLDKNIELSRKFIEENTYFPIDENRKGLRQPIYVEDVATALITALHTSDADNKIIRIGGANRIDFDKFISMIFLRVGYRPDLKSVPMAGFLRKLSKFSSTGNLLNRASLRSSLEYETDNEEALKILGSRPKSFHV